MPRRLFSTLLAVSLATIAPAAPVPTHLMPKEVPFAYPTAVGTTWVYQLGARLEMTFVTTNSKDVPGGKLLWTSRLMTNGTLTPQSVTMVTGAGVFLVAQNRKEYTTPDCLLKLPYCDGQTWEVSTTGPSGDYKAERVVGPAERVNVPAGEFSAVPVHATFTRDGETEQVTMWYASGVGLVQGGFLKLKSFTPGKD